MDLGGEAVATFQFDRPGDEVTGKVTDVSEVQQRDMQSGEPRVWPDGRPRMAFRVTLQTTLRDPADPADTGERSVYLTGSRKPETQSKMAAVLAAVRAATNGGTELAIGGTLTLRYTGDGQRKQAGFSAPKLYSATWVAPAANLGGGQQQERQERTHADRGAPPF